VKVRGREEEGQIYPPLLVLKYGEVTQEDIEANVEVPFTFSVEYEMESSVSRAIEVGQVFFFLSTMFHLCLLILLLILPCSNCQTRLWAGKFRF
jgi:hypothetical protein